MVGLSERKSRDERHALNPEPGDYWQDHGCGVCVVLVVTDDTVLSCHTQMRVDDHHWQWDYSKLLLQTREEFRASLAYSGNTPGYYAYCHPRHLAQDVLEADLTIEHEISPGIRAQLEPVVHPEKKPQRVVCAALRLNGDIICGPRHFCPIMRAQIELHERLRLMRIDNHEFYPWKHAEQGFVDQYGQFLTRLEAWRIAEREGQIRNRCGGDGPDRQGLFSENLY